MKNRFAPLGAVLSVVVLLGWLVITTSRPPVPGSPAPGPPDTIAVEAREAGSVVPCAVPLGWRVPEPDPRFRLTANAARAAVEEAAALWDAAADGRLFIHDPEEGFPIRFVYGGRQARVEERLLAEERLERERERIDAGRRKLEELRGELSEARTRVGDGAPEVRALSRRLAEEEAGLGRRVEDHLRQAERLEEAFGPRAVEAGTYREAIRTERGAVTSVTREIRIHRFEDRDQLLRVLAHELGHALGLGHVPAPGALMSPEHGGQGSPDGPPTVEPEDVEALHARCPDL